MNKLIALSLVVITTSLSGCATQERKHSCQADKSLPLGISRESQIHYAEPTGWKAFVPTTASLNE
jgi:hypothetical protein